MVINDLNQGQLPPPQPLLVTLAPSSGLFQCFKLTPSYTWTRDMGYLMLNCTICFTCPENPLGYYTRYPATYMGLNCTFNLTHWCLVSYSGLVPLNNTEMECKWREGNIPSTWSIQFDPPVGYWANSDLAYWVWPPDDVSRIIHERLVKNVVEL